MAAPTRAGAGAVGWILVALEGAHQIVRPGGVTGSNSPEAGAAMPDAPNRRKKMKQENHGQAVGFMTSCWQGFRGSSIPARGFASEENLASHPAAFHLPVEPARPGSMLVAKQALLASSCNDLA